MDEVLDDLIKFNKETFGNVFKNKRVLEVRITGIQRSLESWDFASPDILEKKLHKEYEEALGYEELIWL